MNYCGNSSGNSSDNISGNNNNDFLDTTYLSRNDVQTLDNMLRENRYYNNNDEETNQEIYNDQMNDGYISETEEDDDNDVGPVFNSRYNDPIFNVLSDNHSRDARDTNYLYNPMLDRGFGIINNRGNQLNQMNEIIDSFTNMGITDITKYSTTFINKVAMNCPICITDYEPDSKSFLSMICGHSFCRECGEHWFKNHMSCPICRYKFNIFN